MKIDLVVTVERYDEPPNFYPISLVTPVQNIIYGGLRIFEHILLDIYSNYQYIVDILNIVRENLAVNWRIIYRRFLIERLIDKNIEVIYIGERSLKDFEKILSRYDTLIFTESSSIRIDTNRVVRTKDVDISKARNLISLVFRYGSTCLESVRSVVDIIDKNILMIGSICRKIRASDNRIIIDSDIGSNVNIPKYCVLFECKIQDHTRLRDGCVIYPEAVIGCEIKNSIIDMYSHAEHSGYIGDSYLGRFVNIGAGTVFSNLKNTKGNVKYLGKKCRLYKFGPMLGDHVKTSIGTLIFSGKCVGSYSHIYGLVNRDIPPVAIYMNGKIERMDPDRLKLMIERWCKKYVEHEGVKCELSILEKSFNYLSTLLEESLSNIVPLYVE